MTDRQQLEALLVEGLDPETVSIYADLLEQEGDDRAAWLRAEIRVARGEAEVSLVAPWRDAWAEGLEALSDVRWRLGFVEALALAADDARWAREVFWDPAALRVRTVELRGGPSDAPAWTQQVEENLGLLLQSPCAASIEELAVASGACVSASLLRAVAQLPRLRALRLDAPLDGEGAGILASSNLEELGLTWNEAVQAQRWPRLRTLLLLTPDLPDPERMPNLASLILSSPRADQVERVVAWSHRLQHFQPMGHDHRPLARLRGVALFQRTDLFRYGWQAAYAAEWLAGQERFEDAVRLYRRAIELEPDNWIYANNLGDALRFLDRPAEALPCFEAALALGPPPGDRALVEANAGKSLIHLGRLEESVPRLRSAIELDPDNGPALYDLACALALLGRPDEAMESLTRALRIHPDFADEMGQDPDLNSLHRRDDFQRLFTHPPGPLTREDYM